MSKKYIVVCQQVIGNPTDGYDIDFGWGGEEYPTRKSAIRNGLKLRGSDDFNIGVVRDGRLISFDWMDTPVETESAVLAEIAGHLGLEEPEDAGSD